MTAELVEELERLGVPYLGTVVVRPSGLVKRRELIAIDNQAAACGSGVTFLAHPIDAHLIRYGSFPLLSAFTEGERELQRDRRRYAR